MPLCITFLPTTMYEYILLFVLSYRFLYSFIRRSTFLYIFFFDHFFLLSSLFFLILHSTFTIDIIHFFYSFSRFLSLSIRPFTFPPPFISGLPPHFPTLSFYSHFSISFLYTSRHISSLLFHTNSLLPSIHPCTVSCFFSIDFLIVLLLLDTK